jgi:hypothetical protein
VRVAANRLRLVCAAQVGALLRGRHIMPATPARPLPKFPAFEFKMVVFETIATAISIASGLASVAKNIYDLVEQRKKKKFKPKKKERQAEGRLLESVDRGQESIKFTNMRNLSQLGQAYRDGDGILVLFTWLTYRYLVLAIAKNQ